MQVAHLERVKHLQNLVEKGRANQEKPKKKSGGIFGFFKKIGKAIGGVAKAVVKVALAPAKAAVKLAKGTARAFVDSLKIAKSVVDLAVAAVKGDKRALAVAGLKFLGNTFNFFSGLAATGTGVASDLVTPFHEKAGQKLAQLSHKINGTRNYINDALEIAEQSSHSLFYKGSSHGPWEVKERPTQTGPKGSPISPKAREAILKKEMGSDVSLEAKELLERNAPVVRQMKDDSYPISTEDLLQHATRKEDGTYELNNRFADDPAANQRHTPAIYGSALRDKTDPNIVWLRYDRRYSNSYSSTGAASNLPKEAWHEGDSEASLFKYDLSKGEIVGAVVYKHGLEGPEGQRVTYSQDQIEFKDGRPVITVAYGSHATGVTGGMERVTTENTKPVEKILGGHIYDRYPTREEVFQGEALDLVFTPENVIVQEVETNGQVYFTETERYKGRLDGNRRAKGSDFPMPLRRG